MVLPLMVATLAEHVQPVPVVHPLVLNQNRSKRMTNWFALTLVLSLARQPWDLRTLRTFFVQVGKDRVSRY